jgi:4-hydroxybenzoate polyprenyltransferase
MMLCALSMAAHTINIFTPASDRFNLLGYIASSTLLSYNLHWYLMSDDPGRTTRMAWTADHKNMLLALSVGSAIAAVYFWMQLLQWWLPVTIPAIIALVYTAPKLPALKDLKSIAYGKTFLLAFTWTYVTVILPMIIFNAGYSPALLLFCLSRFSLIYAICLLFDNRDSEDDLKQGLRTLPTRVSARTIGHIFYTALCFFILITLSLLQYDFPQREIVALLIPGITLAFLYRRSIHRPSDYFYYFFLDGLMMLSALLSIVMAF